MVGEMAFAIADGDVVWKNIKSNKRSINKKIVFCYSTYRVVELPPVLVELYIPMVILL